MSNSKENVIIERFLEAREGHNPDFKSALCKVTTRKTTALNAMLGSEGFDSTKWAIQSLKKSVIEANGIKEGDDLGAKLGIDLRIAQHDSFINSEGSQELRAGEDGPLVTSEGKQVYRSNTVKGVGEPGSEDIKFSYDAQPNAEVKAEEISAEEEV